LKSHVAAERSPPVGSGLTGGPGPGPSRQPARHLHTRYGAFDARQKHSVIANVAIARELAGWCWSLAVMPD
jgi:hypothetical protein